MTEADIENFYPPVGFLMVRLEYLYRASTVAERCMLVSEEEVLKGRVGRKEKIHDKIKVVGNETTFLNAKNLKKL